MATLTVKDSYGHTSSESYTFDIGPPFTYYNRSPTAVILATTDGWNITLDATQSSDPDNDQLTFAWTIDSIELNGQTAYYHPHDDGQYHVSLRVMDDYGLESKQTAYVDFLLNRSISLKATNPIIANETATFHLEQLRRPLFGNFTWSVGDLNLIETGATFTARFPTAGNYTVRVVDPTNQTLLLQVIHVENRIVSVPVVVPQPTTPAGSIDSIPANNRGSYGTTIIAVAGALAFALSRRKLRQ